MRVRKKKNLETRLEQCADYILPISYGDKDFYAPADESLMLNFREIFGNDNPVMLEIGSGKGRFLTEIATLHPEINFIGVEKQSNVIVDACDALRERGVKNVRMLLLAAEYLLRYIPVRSVSRIYLNFSCPFPKEKYKNHRLTAKRFLEIYKVILQPDAEIHQKTDNMKLFEFSIEQLSSNGFALKNVSLDLHRSGFEGNIMTEYEQRFTQMGLPVYRLEAFIQADGQ